MAVNGSAQGTLVGTDHDWFAVTLDANKAYWIDLRTNGVNDLKLGEIRDINNTVVAQGNDNAGIGDTKNARIAFIPIKSGTYYIDVSGDRNYSSAYTLTVSTNIDGYNAPNELYTDFSNGLSSLNTIGRIAVNGGATGAISYSGDQDWFAVQLTAGYTYRIEEGAKESGRGTLQDSYVRICKQLRSGHHRYQR